MKVSTLKKLDKVQKVLDRAQLFFGLLTWGSLLASLVVFTAMVVHSFMTVLLAQ